jgi:hypothetical protein
MSTFLKKQRIFHFHLFHSRKLHICSLAQRKSVVCDAAFKSGNTTNGKPGENSGANEKETNFSFSKNLGSGSSSNSQKQSFSGRKTPLASETPKQQVLSVTYEEIGLFPRSFNRVFDRFFKQIFFDVDNLVIQEYRFYRYLFFTTVKCLFLLFFLPLGINFLSKNYLIRPITEYYWNAQNHEIFLNSYQQKKAFTELKNFEEKIYFEALIVSEKQFFLGNQEELPFLQKEEFSPSVSSKIPEKNGRFEQSSFFEQKGNTVQNKQNVSLVFSNSLQKQFQTKILELAHHYNEESIEAVTNFFADVLSFSTLCFLFYRLEIQINITKSFLLEVFFGLDDSKKSLLILFVTDLLVGYHSPNIWELFFQTIFDHYGLPESQTTIFLLVATLPVLLDVLFKYLIFRHLNRASPATVATYHAMIE